MQLLIVLPDALYTELQEVSAEVKDLTYSPACWAAEAVEAALASRRLPRVRIPITPLDVFQRKAIECGSEDTELT